MSKQNKQKLTDANSNMVVTKGEARWGMINRVKWVKYMVMEEDLTLG